MAEEVNPLYESLKNAKVISRGEYRYVVHPLADGIPEVRPELLEYVSRRVADVLKEWSFEKIVTVEAMGIPVASAVSLHIRKPLVVVRKRSYGLEGEVAVRQRTGYSEGRLYINSVRSGDRVALVDDVLSTGSTLRAVVHGLREIGAGVVGAVVVMDKSGRREEMERELGIPIVAISEIRVSENGVEVLKA